MDVTASWFEIIEGQIGGPLAGDPGCGVRIHAQRSLSIVLYSEYLCGCTSHEPYSGRLC